VPIPATTPGHSLVVVGAGNAGTGTVTDDAGDSFSLASQSTDLAHSQTDMGVFFAPNIAGGATHITAPTVLTLWIYEVDAPNLILLGAGALNGVIDNCCASSHDVPGPALAGSTMGNNFYVAAGSDNAGNQLIGAPFSEDFILGHQSDGGHFIGNGVVSTSYHRAFSSGDWQTTGAVFGFANNGGCTSGGGGGGSGPPTGTSAGAIYLQEVWDIVPLGTVHPPVPAPGTEDLLEWANMDSRRFTEHLIETFSYLNGDSSATQKSDRKFWWIKNSAGNPWDINRYDDNRLYFWITENGEQDPSNPAAYKRFVTPVPLMPRFFVPGSTFTIDTPGPNLIKRTVNCEVDNQTPFDLGHIRGVTSGPTTIAWGGDLGSQSTIELDYFWGGTGSTYNTRERFYLVKNWGRVKWDTSHWTGSAYVVDSSSTHNTLGTGGSPDPNFTCGFSATWWP
jgi:hypothetical protein